MKEQPLHTTANAASGISLLHLVAQQTACTELSMTDPCAFVSSPECCNEMLQFLETVLEEVTMELFKAQTAITDSNWNAAAKQLEYAFESLKAVASLKLTILEEVNRLSST